MHKHDKSTHMLQTLHVSGCGKHLSSLPLAVPHPTQACHEAICSIRLIDRETETTGYPRSTERADGLDSIEIGAKREVKRGVERWAKLNVLLPQSPWYG